MAVVLVVVSRLVMIDKSYNTVEMMSVKPSTALVPTQATTSTTQPNWLPLEVCVKLWVIQTQISWDFKLHQLYEIHRDLLLAIVGLEVGDNLDRSQF